MTPEIAHSIFMRPRRNAETSNDFGAFVPGAMPFSFRHRNRLVRGIIQGTKGKTVLLMHGWESSAFHLHDFMLQLRHEGFRVAAIDAPAHGNSEGEQTHVGEMGQAILMAQAEIGKIDAVIAHSAGSPAALYAFSQGLNVEASVHIAGPASFDRVLQRFAAACGLDQQGFESFRALVHRDLEFDPDLLEEDAVTRDLSHPGLLIHDPHDKEVPFNESRRLYDKWPKSELLSVDGLGHRRIIQDDNVIKLSVAFLKQKLLVPARYESVMSEL